MLLQHAWLAPAAKPETIIEEDEEAAEAAAAEGADIPSAADSSVAPGPDAPNATSVQGVAAGEDFVDREVGEWVISALDRRRRGVMGKAAKPALHAAALDQTAAVAGDVGSPVAAA